MRPDLPIIFEELRTNNSHILSKFDPDKCIELFDQVPSDRRYTFVPDGVNEIWASIAAEFGDSGFDAFQRMTMLRLMENFDARAQGKQYSDSILECFGRSYERIARSIADVGFRLYCTKNDILLKDLSLCRQSMFPAGMRIIEPDSGFHRSLMFRGGLSQALRFAKLLVMTGGNNHWYQCHTHLSELEEFNAPGWERCGLRLAQMLQLHPEIRGVWMGSWFNDPEIANISPRLTYLRKMPEENGAVVFFNEISINGGALQKSKARKNLYNEGKYLPKSYIVIWPRQPLLRWAEAHRSAPAETGLT